MTRNRTRLFWLTASLVVLGALGVAALTYWPRQPTVRTDPVAAAHANLRGVGYMERFDYAAAAKEFEEVVKLDPNWLPGQINLGIALLNTQEPDNLKRAIDLFRKVLEKDPDNCHAHYCLGIIYLYQNRRDEAATQFETVTRLDPTDAYAWYQRGLTSPDKDESPQAKRFYRKALDLNPYLNAARYALAQHSFEHDDKKSKELLDEFQALANAHWEADYRLVYSEMGRYAEVIGRVPIDKPAAGPLPLFERYESFQVTLAEGTRWAKAEGLGQGTLGELRRAVRERFGGTLVRLDYNGDGRPDILLLGAVVRGGEVRDLLLRNDGGGRFTDVTAQVGLAGVPASFGCSVADFDNDGLLDLLLTGPAGIRLFRNVDGTRFEDKTAAAGFDKVAGVCLGSGWVDLDQDGDLDLLVARYAANIETALARLKGKKTGNGGDLLVFLNIGEARPAADGKPLGLTCRFRPATEPAALRVKGPVTTFAATDLDADKDIDLLVFADGQAPVAVLNDRLLRFHRDEVKLAPAQDWNGGLVFDANHDEQSDLLLLPTGQKPLLLLSQRDTPAEGLRERFAAGATDSPPLLQAQAVDLDLDGWTDVVGLSQSRAPVLLHNDGTGRLVLRAGALAPLTLPSPPLIGGEGRVRGVKANDLLAVAVCDLDGDGLPDVLLWSAAEGLQAWRNLGNGNHGLRLELTGRRDKASSLRTNADAIGASVTAYAGPLHTMIENTTLAAGLGQSRLPLDLGLHRASAADVVRIRWPDGVPQAELNQSAGEVLRVAEINRKSSSCPVLLTWNGSRFVFVTDFLGAGSMGELSSDGSTRPPRPEESLKIEPSQLVPRDGRYVLKIAEPMDEVLYLDYLRLDVIDHPADLDVFPDERFVVSGPPPTQEVLAFRAPILPVRAADHRGRDVTAVLRERDGKTVDGFATRLWTGFAEEHFVELDFADQLAKRPTNDRLFLVLAGWTEYPYPESIFAAEQAGVPMLTPLLEKLDADGKWQSLGEIGFPAGLPRVMTVPVRGLAGQQSCRLRIRTNLQIYWDQIYLAPLAEDHLQVRSLEVEQATLAHRGFMRQVGQGTQPVSYDDDRTETVAVTRWQGTLTRAGDVTELLRRDDDRFVLCGPGDEITVAFNCRELPPLPTGWVRSFVLRTQGYCKDASPFTLTGGSIEPLPFRGMKSYPPRK
jgi:cytochrome c-type biogenesis protein CcmH/NrfG